MKLVITCEQFINKKYTKYMLIVQYSIDEIK